METHRSTPKDGWITGENGQIYGAARPQDIERYFYHLNTSSDSSYSP